MENELITIVILAFNSEKIISRAIESVVNQTYNNLDILIIDDGSTDSTPEILDKYAEKDNRIRSFHTTNGGSAKAMNFALTKAKGKYICVCDHDDYMHPEYVEKMYSAICKEEANIAICAWNNVDSNGALLHWKTANLSSCGLSSKNAQKLFLTSFLFEGFWWNKMVKRTVFCEKELHYDESVIYADIFVYYSIICDSEKIAYVEDKLYDYYQVPTSYVHTPNMKKHRDYIQVLEQVREAAVKRGMAKEGESYIVYRLNRYLFELYKDRAYMTDELKKFYCQAYSKWLKISFARKAKIICGYKNRGPVKETLKALFVAAFYRSLCREE